MAALIDRGETVKVEGTMKKGFKVKCQLISSSGPTPRCGHSITELNGVLYVIMGDR